MLEPVSRKDWNAALAAHLLNRAGFGGSPDMIERYASMKPEEAVESLVQYSPQDVPPPEWADGPDAADRPDRRAIQAMSEEEKDAFRRKERRVQVERLIDLRGWWLNRMRTGAAPLEEKLTLFWHGHFATSAEKVREPYVLYLQNQTLRRHAAGNWRDMLVAVARDPAMLLYLDNARSRKGKPNENFARELMELFSLGEGRYTEEDIRHAALALTGWTLHQDRFEFVDRERMRDGKHLEFLGSSSVADGYDVIDAILRQPACAPFIASKLWRFFAYDDIDTELAEQLGAVLRGADYELRPLLMKIFLSRAFYSTRAARSQIKSPVYWLVNACIQLETELPPPEACSMIMRTLGQELFAPPNVKGWNGGYSWITASTLIQRYNLAGFLVKGSDEMFGRKQRRPAMDMKDDSMMYPMARVSRSIRSFSSAVDPDSVLPAAHRSSVDAAWRHLEWRMYQRTLSGKEAEAVTGYLSGLPAPEQWSGEQLRHLLHVMMSTPYYQVC